MVDASTETPEAPPLEETPPVQAVEALPPSGRSWGKIALICAGIAIAAFALSRPQDEVELDGRTIGILSNNACEQIAVRDLSIGLSELTKATAFALDSGRLYCEIGLKSFSKSVLERFKRLRCHELTSETPWVQFAVPIERFTHSMQAHYSRMKEFCHNGLCQVRFMYPGKTEDLPLRYPDEGPACKQRPRPSLFIPL
jgi:hypothetical protein